MITAVSSLLITRQTCAHLYELRQRITRLSETRDPIGRCYVLSEDLSERDDLDGGEWKFCEGRPQGHEQFGFCQQGLAASFTPDNNYILFGAPGTYNWKGTDSSEQRQFHTLYCKQNYSSSDHTNIYFLGCFSHYN